MSKKLKVRTVKRNNLPYGKFNYILTLNLRNQRASSNRSNAHEMVDVRRLLKDTCKDFKMIFCLNHKKRRVYTTIYLVNPMDVAMVKLVHQEKIRKIYKVEVDLYGPASLPDELNSVIEEQPQTENIV
jgi:CCR4-NOT transcriptional regulation complex NOT5 subunit